MNRGARIVGLVFALALIGVWILFSYMMVSLALDYPIRRAGENELYPARGTSAFYWGCTTAVSRMFFFTSFMWALPLALAIFLLLRNLGIRSTALRLLVILTVFVGPVIVSGIYEIFVVYTNSQVTQLQSCRPERAGKVIEPTAGTSVFAFSQHSKTT